MASVSAVEMLAILETRLPPGSINAVKRTVFCHSWEGLSYGLIAEEAGYDADYIRESGAILWRSISELLHQKVTKRNFRALLLQKFFQQCSGEDSKPAVPIGFLEEPLSGAEGSWHDCPHTNEAAVFPTANGSSEPISDSSLCTSCDWGDAPDVSVFYGRQQEQEQIERAVKHRARLFVLMGMGGVGKTALAVKVAERFQGEFDYVIWRSLRNAPPIQQLLNQLLAFFSDQKIIEGNLNDLLIQLRKHRCLVVLDNLETLMESGKVGSYRPGFEDYGQLFRAWGEVAHQSFLILTTREKPLEIVPLEGEQLSVRVMALQGELGVAQALLRDKRVEGSPGEIESLCRLYSSNPLALKLVATSIQSLFDRQISTFLADGSLALDGLQRLLDEQLQRLSCLEAQVLLWLAINRTWTSVEDLHRELVPPVARSQVVRTLERLKARSLIQLRRSHYGLQSVVMEYLLEQLVEQLFHELIELGANPGLSVYLHQSEPSVLAGELPRIHTHALVKTQTLEYIREAQKASILGPLAQRLRQVMRSPQRLRQHIQSLFEHLRGSEVGSSGYASANVLDLALYLRLDLTNLDASGLTYRQADLRHAQLHQVNFSQAEFVDCLFTQVFSSLLSLDYSPNGQLMAAGDSCGNIHVWQAPCKVLLETFSAHRGRIHSLAFSPDGQILASGGDDGQIRLWTVETWANVGELSGHKRFIWSLDWNPDGTLLASGGGDRTVCLWDIEANICLRTLEFPGSWIQAVAFSPDGSLLATGGDDSAVRLWDIPSGQYLGCLLGHERWVCALTFSPDGCWLATASHDRTVRLWAADSGDCLRVLQGHKGSVRSLQFSLDGQLLVTASSDQTLRLWELSSGSCLRTLIGHIGWVQDVAFSSDGTTVVSGGHDQTLRSWNATSGTCLEVQHGYARGVRTVHWHCDGNALVTCGNDHSVQLWNVKLKTMQTLASEETSGFWVSLWSPDGSLLATGSKNHSIQIWSSKTGRLLRTLVGHRCWVGTLCFAPEGHRLVSGSADNTLRLWDVRTGRCLRQLEGHSGRVCSVDFEPQGRWLVSGSADHSIRLWDSETGQYIRPYQGHGDLVTVVRVSLTGRYLASGSLDRSIKLWDLSSGECLMTLANLPSSVTCLCWQPHSIDEQEDAERFILVAGSTNGQVSLWTLEPLLKGLQSQESKETTSSCQGLEPDHWTRHVRLLGQHQRAVWDVAFNPDGARVASVSDDGSTRIWQLQTGECLEQLVAEGPYARMNIDKVSGLTDAQIYSLQMLGASVFAFKEGN